MKEWLHIVIFTDHRAVAEGQPEKPLWVIDIYRTDRSRLDLNPDAPDPAIAMDTLEIDAPHLLIIQPGQKFTMLLDWEVSPKKPVTIRRPLPLRNDFHLYAVFNAPAVVTGEEEQE